MDRLGTGFGLLIATLLVLPGCKTQPFIRPPKPPEELRAPPIEEVRFSQPPDYPKNVMNEDKIKKPSGANKDDPSNMPHGGMGRPGGPSGGSY